jgi:hypothetical protein
VTPDVILVPSTYKCREHNHDLTESVLAKVAADDIEVSGGFGYRPGRPGSERETAFKVRVWCDAGKSERHELVFRGRRRA